MAPSSFSAGWRRDQQLGVDQMEEPSASHGIKVLRDQQEHPLTKSPRVNNKAAVVCPVVAAIASPPAKKVVSSSFHHGRKKSDNNIFAGIAEFLAGFGRNQHKKQDNKVSKNNSGSGRQVRFATDNTSTSTPLTTADSAHSRSGVGDRGDGGPDPSVDAYTREYATLSDEGWSSEPDGTMDLRPAEHKYQPPVRRSRPVSIIKQSAEKRTAVWGTAGAAERGCPGNGAPRCDDLSVDEAEEKVDGAAETEEEKGNVRGDASSGSGGVGHDDQEKIRAWQRTCNSKTSSFTETTFVPCYATFTPHMTTDALQGMKYKTPETRVPSAVAPPSSVARPNYHDALRRVAVVVYQHIKTCEWRRERAEARRERDADAQMAPRRPASMHAWRRSAPSLVALKDDESALWGQGGREGYRRGAGVVDMGMKRGAPDPYNARQAEVFHEKHFVSPVFRYKFVQAPVMALPGAMFTLREVRSTPKPPSVDEIYEFVKTLFNKACLSSECSLVCLIYVERLMEVAQVPLLAGTWKPVLLCGLLLASKVWQDLSSWNVEFSTVYPEYSLKSINRLELLFLSAIKWDMSISSSLYAKYYFALRSLAEKKDFRRRYNQVMQIDAPRATRVEERANALKRDVININSMSMLSKSL